MVRIALIAAAILLVVGGAFIFLRETVLKPNSAQSQIAPREVPLSTESGQLTNQVHDLINQANQPLSVNAQPEIDNAKITELTSRVKNLETSVSDLRAQIVALNSATGTNTTSTTTSSARPPLYIPLNFNGQVNSTSWQTLPNQTLAINPSNYPGYTSMVLIVQLEVYQGNGTAYAQLVNTANNQTVPASQVSTNTYYFSQVTSSSFTLPAGNQPYGIQLQTLVPDYPAIIQSATLMVNF